MSEPRPSEITIRQATPADAATIAEYNLVLAAESEDRALDPTLLARGVRLLLADTDRGRYWVAEAGGGIVGQCMVTTEWSDWSAGRYWWLQSVYVVPAWRGRGVLRALWNHVLAEARALGDVASVRLYVERDNLGARQAYERLGMEETPYLVYEHRLPFGSER
jgi:GNAT superfamily N-acetyltransferase